MVSRVLEQAILNPNIPDIVGSFDRGRERQRVGKERQRADQSRTLAGQALQGVAGSLDELQGMNPELALELADHMQARDARGLNDLIRDAKIGVGMLQRNDPQGFLVFAEQRLQAIKARGGNTTITENVINLVKGGQQEAALRQMMALTESIDNSKRAASTKAFAPVVDPATGQLGIPTFDPATKQAGFQVVPGAPIQQTPEERRLASIETKQAEADISVSATERKEEIKQRISRSSKIKTELSERNRSAARSARTLRQALTLAEGASQGLTGAAKLQLSRLIPGIDASQEGVLDSTLLQLSLEQLQNFTGPTTDFEFGVTQSIVGGLGQSKQANIARVKSLDRARFFNEREFKQFTRHIKDGGDPDNFRFNFAEVIKTKKGPFTLQDIQDTAVQNTLTIEETIARLNK